MNHLKEPLVIGSLTLPNRIIHSPLAGCSDFPFRQMVRRFSSSLIYCEMVKMDPLVRHDKGTYQLLDFDETMHPIGAQLCGSKPELAAASARIIEELGFDVIDLNCGCPVDKVTKDGSGSGLLRHPERIGEILSNIISAVKIPVTVKIRIGWDDDTINASEVVATAERAGAALVAIHGRTREQGYNGKANRDVIRDAKLAAKAVPVAGNGDIFDPGSALHMFEHTACDAILISRGILGQPFLAQDILHTLDGRELPKRTPQDSLNLLIDHLTLIEAYQADKRPTLEVRRVGPWYCKEIPNISSLRGALSKVASIHEAKELVHTFIKSSGSA